MFLILPSSILSPEIWTLFALALYVVFSSQTTSSSAIVVLVTTGLRDVSFTHFPRVFTPSMSQSCPDYVCGGHKAGRLHVGYRAQGGRVQLTVSKVCSREGRRHVSNFSIDFQITHSLWWYRCWDGYPYVKIKEGPEIYYLSIDHVYY